VKISCLIRRKKKKKTSKLITNLEESFKEAKKQNQNLQNDLRLLYKKQRKEIPDGNDTANLQEYKNRYTIKVQENEKLCTELEKALSMVSLCEEVDQLTNALAIQVSKKSELLVDQEKQVRMNPQHYSSDVNRLNQLVAQLKKRKTRAGRTIKRNNEFIKYNCNSERTITTSLSFVTTSISTKRSHFGKFTKGSSSSCH